MPIKTKYDRAEVLKLHAEGKSKKEIADWTGYKPSTIAYILKDEQKKAKADKPAKTAKAKIAPVAPVEVPTERDLKISEFELAIFRQNKLLREETAALWTLVRNYAEQLGKNND